MLRAQHPAREGRFLEAILKAERDVASTAASNRGHEKPGTAASPERLVAWSLRAGPGNGDGGGTWADNATAERREAGLLVAREVSLPRKRGVARYCATVQGWTSLGAPPIPSLGGRQRRRREEEGEEPGGKNAPGPKKPGLFDIVNRKTTRCDASARCRSAIASAATHSVSAEGAPRRAPYKLGSLALAKGAALPI